MKLAVSNLAWDPSNRLKAYQLMANNCITGLEIAPGFFFFGAQDPYNPDKRTAIEACNELKDAGLTLVSMQSLLFGANSAKLFGNKVEYKAFYEAMVRSICLAEQFEIPHMVFGSPKNRIIPSNMCQNEARQRAIETFHNLGNLAQKAGTKLGLEFNPSQYTNFLNDHNDSLSFVLEVNHSAVELTLDTGALLLNGSFNNLNNFMKIASNKISHVHLSAPHLMSTPIETGVTENLLSALDQNGYNNWISIEMKKANCKTFSVLESRIQNLVSAVLTTKRTY